MQDSGGNNMGGIFGGGGGGGNAPVAQPGPNVMQPGPMPGYIPPAPAMPPMRNAPAPNFGTPNMTMPQLAPGVTLPAQRQQARTAGTRMIAMGKALQSIGSNQPQQPQRGAPVNFNTAPMPIIRPPNSINYGGG